MKKILVIQTAFIGDAVLTLPMIQKLKEKYPESLIDVITIPSTKDIFESSPYTNEVIILNKKGEQKSLIALIKFSKNIRQRKYDLIFAPHRSLRTTFIVMNSGVRETYGFSNASLMHAYKYMVEYNYNDHEAKRNLDLIGYDTSSDKWKIQPEVPSNEAVNNKVSGFINSISNNGKRFCAVAPGSVWNTKKYPSELYKEIINLLLKKDYFILLIGGEEDKNLCDEIAQYFPADVISAAGKFNLVESVELLRRVEFLISNDSAPVHLGMCAGIPVLTIYCSTTPMFGFYPYNDRSSYISYDDLKCKPCGIHGHMKCPIKSFICAYELKPEDIILKLEEMINGKD